MKKLIQLIKRAFQSRPIVAGNYLAKRDWFRSFEKMK